jgi:hypothetical protein
MPATVVVSPHLGDAVLSCWAVLDTDGARTVVNVFTGIPDPGRERSWDELARATDGARRMQERIAEDRAALARAGCTPTNLDLRPPASEHAAAHLREVLAAAVPPGCDLYLPAGIGGHPAHVLVRDVGLEVCGRAGHTLLYADYPRIVEHPAIRGFEVAWWLRG